MNIAPDRALLIAQNLQPLGKPPRSQLKEWDIQPETQEQLPVGIKPSRTSEAELRAQLAELEAKIEGRGKS